MNDEDKKPRLRLKEQPKQKRGERDEPGNPIFNRLPEPKVPLVSPRMLRALRVGGVLVVLAALVVGVLLFLNVGGGTDVAIWERSMETLVTLQEKPADAAALEALYAIIAEIPDEVGNRSVLSGLKADYALGLLGRGRDAAGLAACRHVQEQYPDAGFAEFVVYTNLATRVEEDSRPAESSSRRVSPPVGGQLSSTARTAGKRLGGNVPPPRKVEKPDTGEAALPEEDPGYRLNKTMIKAQYDAALSKVMILVKLKVAEGKGKEALRTLQEKVKRTEHQP